MLVDNILQVIGLAGAVMIISSVMRFAYNTSKIGDENG